MLRGQCSYKKKDDGDIFYSVAHLEEYFKARKNSAESDIDKLNRMKEICNILVSRNKNGRVRL